MLPKSSCARCREDRDRGHLWAGPGTLRCEALLLLARGSLESCGRRCGGSGGGLRAKRLPTALRPRAARCRRGAATCGGATPRRRETRRGARDFLELGAACWAERCDIELRRARPRPRRDSELTHAERRVAALVALGKKNREVAAQLFTTVSTVEAHLTRIYRKLGIRSRTELARLVADGRLSLDDD